MKRLLVLTLFVLSAAETDDFVAAMKTTGATMGPLMKSLSAGQMGEVAAGAKKLETVFQTSEKFWAGRNAPDAVKWSQDALAGAKALGVAADAGDAAAAKAALGQMATNCKGCHDAHREKLPDGTYKIK